MCEKSGAFPFCVRFQGALSMTGDALWHRRTIKLRASDAYGRIANGPESARDKRIIDLGLEQPDCRGCYVMGSALGMNRLLR